MKVDRITHQSRPFMDDELPAPLWDRARGRLQHMWTALKWA